MSNVQQALLLGGLVFGDETKGAAIDFYTRLHNATCVIRYSGASQCGHNVVTPAGQHHVFSQFGSGALAGAATHLSRFMLIDPIAMLAEAAHLQGLLGYDPLTTTTLEGSATLITPYHVAANQLRELSRASAGGRHGSCGKGVGEARGDMLRNPGMMPVIADLHDLAVLREKLEALQAMKLAEMVEVWGDRERPAGTDRLWEILTDRDWIAVLLAHYAAFRARARIVGPEHLGTLLRRPGTVLFEGAQGVLLDETRGFYPHTTWTDTTFQNADTLLDEAGYMGERRRIGLTRCYGTRHGAGPFPTEDERLRPIVSPGEHNIHNDWQGGFRVGHVDAVLLRYAIRAVGGVDEIGVSHLDRFEAQPIFKIATGYQALHGHADTTALFDGARAGRDVRFPEETSLDHQERMGAELRKMIPVYESRDGASGAHFARVIAEAVGVPLGLVAYGPTAADRRVVNG